MAECVHDWGEWETILWYTPKGRFTGEFRKCRLCTAVETRNIAIDSRPAVIQPTISVYAGIFNPEGKLLLRRRPVNPKDTFAGDWELPGGGISAEKASHSKNEGMIGQALTELVFEKTGIKIPKEKLPQAMPSMYPAVLPGGGDWAFVILVGVVEQVPTGGEYKYVSPDELFALAKGSKSNQLLSGWGKRMCRLCLRVLASRDCPNPDYRKRAGGMLSEIQTQWDS